MRKVEFNIIDIEWSKTKIVEDVFNFKKEDLEEIENKEYCLYQAYGDSPIYGRDKLLYIGQTKSSLRRTIEHMKSDFNRILNFSLYIGEIRFEESKREGILDISESILISLLKPSYNSSNVKDIRQVAKDESYLILNKGNRGAIPLECSNIWWRQ